MPGTLHFSLSPPTSTLSYDLNVPTHLLIVPFDHTHILGSFPPLLPKLTRNFFMPIFELFCLLSAPRVLPTNSFCPRGCLLHPSSLFFIGRFAAGNILRFFLLQWEKLVLGLQRVYLTFCHVSSTYAFPSPTFQLLWLPVLRLPTSKNSYAIFIGVILPKS